MSNVKMFCVLWTVALIASSATASEKVPAIKTGDIIFQTSNSNQSWAIMWATTSVYSHVGIVEVANGKTSVIEAIGVVSKTPLAKWIERGKLGRYSVFRLKDANETQIAKAIQTARTMLKLPYDPYFNLDDQRIYCSELVYKAYRNAGIEIGTMQKTKDLNVDNFLVRKLFKQRWRKHPACKSISVEEKCWEKILDSELVTPESQTKDSKLQLIYSNY